MIKENLCIPSEAMEIVPNSLRSIISIHETIHEVSFPNSLKSFLKISFRFAMRSSVDQTKDFLFLMLSMAVALWSPLYLFWSLFTFISFSALTLTLSL